MGSLSEQNIALQQKGLNRNSGVLKVVGRNHSFVFPVEAAPAVDWNIVTETDRLCYGNQKHDSGMRNNDAVGGVHAAYEHRSKL